MGPSGQDSFLNEEWFLKAAKGVRSGFPSICRVLDRLDSSSMIHGDFHAGNIFFRRDCDELRVLDWQIWGKGIPASEFAYIFTLAHTNPGSEFDPAQLDSCLRLYHDTLTSQPDLTGISKDSFPLEVLRAQAECVFCCMLFSMLYMSKLSSTPETLARNLVLAAQGDPMAKKKKGMAEGLDKLVSAVAKTCAWILLKNPKLEWEVLDSAPSLPHQRSMTEESSVDIGALVRHGASLPKI